ncbi:MAG: exo-alpha-sialidase [Planctomycetota bacterium]|nr:exo-alpha-sialidase [Planctomycetota bacterium]
MDCHSIESRLHRLATSLIDQHAARVIVAPRQDASGFWFGGGNLTEIQGTLYLVGRYRNAGDSRLGLAAGERGLALAILASKDQGESFQTVLELSKTDLSRPETPVLSIEGCALRATPEGVELFVSTEKDGVGYPAGFESYLKPGTGVWSIDRLRASSVEGLATARVEQVVSSDDPQFVHIKDPFLYERDSLLLFCSHPFSWTSSNTGCVRLNAGSSFEPEHGVFSRGFTWDVAMTRATSIVDIPATGELDGEDIGLVFYDGGECVRNLDEHKSSVSRPRGYSCEELGGCGYIQGGRLGSFSRLSKHEAMFVSPWGTGCSRYVDVLRTNDGLLATWQQSQTSGAQPLVMHRLSNERIDELLR